MELDAVRSPDTFLDLFLRLLIATACGIIVGVDRELADKPAGVRTHALVALGAALFGVVALRLTSIDAVNPWDPASRVLQGVIAGVGFVGGGVILRREQANAVSGLTTASSIWVAAALGVSAALGLWVSSALGATLALLILVAGRYMEAMLARFRRPDDGPHPGHTGRGETLRGGEM